MNTLDRLKNILCEQLGVDPAIITLESSIRNDFGGDDEDLLELATIIEAEFGVSVTGPLQIQTVGDAVSLIEKLMNHGQSPEQIEFWNSRRTIVLLESQILRAGQHGDFDSVRALKAQRRSLKPSFQTLENKIWKEMPEWYLMGMQPYGDKGGNPNIKAFDLGPDSIVILLNDSSVYLFDSSNVGENNTDLLKEAALLGRGIDYNFNWMKDHAKRLR